MNKKIISCFIMICITRLATAEPSSEYERLAEAEGWNKFHHNNQLPLKLVVDAGVKAKTISSSEQQELLFLEGYQLGALEELSYSQDIEEAYSSAAKTCKANNDALGCGYQSGVEAIRKRDKEVSLQDFGYFKKNIYGRFVFVDKKLFSIKTKDYELWITPASKQILYQKLTSTDCYNMEGYLSLEGMYGPRGNWLSREFILTEATIVQSSKCQPLHR